MAGDNMNFREQYVAQLGEWDFGIPLKFLWFVEIETIPGYVSSASMSQHEPVNKTQSAAGGTNTDNMDVWDIDDTKKDITKKQYMETKAGCILAQGVVLPGEQFNTDTVTINNNMGFLPGLISGNRDAPTELTVQFRETNASLPDMVFRPWIELTSHMGLVARKEDSKNIKTNMRVIQLAKTGPSNDLIRRKTWSFYNCVPVGIDGAELTYDENEIKLYNVRWRYTHYGIASKTGQQIKQPDRKSTRQSQFFTASDYDVVSAATRDENARIRQKIAQISDERVELTKKLKSSITRSIDFSKFDPGAATRKPKGAVTSKSFGQSAPRRTYSRSLSTANWGSRMNQKNKGIGGLLNKLRESRRQIREKLDLKAQARKRLNRLLS